MLAGRPNPRSVPGTFTSAHSCAKALCEPPRHSHAGARKFEITRRGHEMTLSTAPRTSHRPRAPGQVWVIVSLHKGETFLLLCGPACPPWSALCARMTNSLELSQTRAEALGAPQTAGQGAASHGASPPGVGSRSHAHRRPAGTARGRPSTLAERLQHRLPVWRCFEARWGCGAGADGTPCSGRMAAWIAPNSGSPRA